MPEFINFANRQNRFLSLNDVSHDYLQEIKNKTKSDPYYPVYHIAPHHGLLNDPNGLSFYNGRYHIFYQWFPLGPVHGLKYWYHVSTSNFIDFKDHGVALKPDQPFDSHGCFSGCAITEEDELHLYYTGNRVTEENEVHQSQVYAKLKADGQLADKKVIVETPPKGFSEDFRDPFVFVKNRTYFMLVGGRQTNGEGGIALFEGEDKENLTYKGTLNTNFNGVGHMWECPNYFEHKEKGIVIFSPQGQLPKDKYHFNNVFSVVYAIGDCFDFDDVRFNAEKYHELDKGFDFYAPQIFEDDKSRHILIGWLGNSKNSYPTDENMWAHMLTIPREILIESGRLVQKPLKELVDLRGEAVSVRGEHRLHTQSFELEVNADPHFEMVFMNNDGDYVTFSSSNEEYCLDRTHMTEVYAVSYGTKRYAMRKVKNAHIIRIFIDRSSLEIFCDNGETVFTSRIFIKNLTTLKTSGVTGDLYNLKPIHLSEKN
ncbi:glycoside hydrolase family 32 protein [Salipaludibacillus aurantiacus]|uniref:Sucrose-6-phosphate hydrolase n=1 Tax=Salipaludibacillus aurantiacus TaxID=1601833 RepID=A0A1H9W3W4_9BACI|nr:sucrose-6-phosphate hydrolase [Salipaludibacillus aurantiacus]SES28630.1 beta-fructofuranosidase [Salipaludibacillus aurantiacus]